MNKITENYYELPIKEFALDPLPPRPSIHSEEQSSDGSHVNFGFDDSQLHAGVAEINPKATLKEYLLSIIYMPRSLRQVYDQIYETLLLILKNI